MIEAAEKVKRLRKKLGHDEELSPTYLQPINCILIIESFSI
jgi:hypothetical protein